LTPKERRRLVRRKKKIEALLPVVSTERGQRMRLTLKAINNKLATDPRTNLSDVDMDNPAEAVLDGRGTLQFQAESPPGVGRLIRLPFYLTLLPSFDVAGPLSLKPEIYTDGGASQPAVSNPTVIAKVHGSTLGPFVMATPVLEWATLRIVGFQAYGSVRPSLVTSDVNTQYNTRPLLLARELQVGGGTNLLPAAGYSDATVYTPFVPEFPGLRANPILRSPNFATVRMAVSGTPGTPATITWPDAPYYFVTFTANLVCEILEDKDFGRHIPGPYARLNATARDPWPAGQSFLLQ
jgi:hypothetical protein